MSSVSKPPNLFDYAPSELSQDAFLSWLISWADPKYQTLNPALHATGIRFLEKLLAKHNLSLPSPLTDVKVLTQREHIDVLVEINGTHAVIIEDKIETNQHGDQLRNYITAVLANSPPNRIAKVYLKTYNQSSYKDVLKWGYFVFRRAELIDVLQLGRTLGVKSDIFRDFHEKIEGLHSDLLAYRWQPVYSKWEWNHWEGQYSDLQALLGDGQWAYANNPSKSYYVFYWHARPVPANDPHYAHLLQWCGIFNSSMRSCAAGFR